MHSLTRTSLLGCLILGMFAGCSSADSDEPSSLEQKDGNSKTQTLCEKYGGPQVVDQVVKQNIIGTIAEDCRVNAFFTSLSEDAFTRVGDCLSIQVQELFSCDGVSYAGASASNGLPCRNMKEAHRGLNITSADFNALIEDVVAGLTDAGVDAKDIEAAAPALLGMEGDIVERPDSMDHERGECSMDQGAQ